jgi:MoaA/NifB/PqqE/SkfB family radical SAM enzyme
MPQIIHILLTYTCPLRCKHCYVFGGPKAKGRYTSGKLKDLLSQIEKVGSVHWIIFDGGEPFWHFPLLLAGIKYARQMGFKVGVITNGYFARTEETAVNFLRPIGQLGVSQLYISDDTFHYRSTKNTPAKRARQAAQGMGIPTTRINIEMNPDAKGKNPGEIDGSPRFDSRMRFRGRATNLISNEMKTHNWQKLTRCPATDLDEPESLSIDPFGNVSICQGLTIGNALETSFSDVIKSYQIDNHPFLSALKDGGPALLASRFSIEPDHDFGDACHLCYEIRSSLVPSFPQYLAPRHVYGLEKA